MILASLLLTHALCASAPRPCVLKVQQPPPTLVKVGDMVEVYYKQRKGRGDYYVGTVDEHIRENIFAVAFEDGDIHDVDFDPKSLDIWRRPPLVIETSGDPSRRLALAAAATELTRRVAATGMEAQLAVAERARELREAAALSDAAKMEKLLLESHPPKAVTVPEDSMHGMLLSSGNIVFDTTRSGMSPSETDRVFMAWAAARTELLHEELEDEEEYEVDYFPFSLDERERLLNETGLLAMAGHEDQEGEEYDGKGGMTTVRVIGDDFFVDNSDYIVAPAVAGAPVTPTTDGLARVATVVTWADLKFQGVQAKLSATRTRGTTAETVADVGARGALPSANLLIFPRPMAARKGQCVNLGPPVELATGFGGWRVVATFTPRRQAHGNFVLGLRDCDGRSTCRVVPYITHRYAAAVRRARRLPAVEWQALDHAAGEDYDRLAEMRPVGCDTEELVAGLRSLLSRCDVDVAEPDTATGGRTVTVGRRERVQRLDTQAASEIVEAAQYPVRLRAVHVNAAAEAAWASGAVGPLTAQATADVAAVWPTVTAKLEALLSAECYALSDVQGREACFPPKHLLSLGPTDSADWRPVMATQIALRLTEAHLPPLSCMGSCSVSEGHVCEEHVCEEVEECMYALMSEPCGMHSDAQDVDAEEMIVYVHSPGVGSTSTPTHEVGRLAMSLRLRGGAGGKPRRSKRIKKKKKKTKGR